MLKGLPLASVAFNTPEHLSLDKTSTFELLLSMQDPVNELKQEISEAGARAGARIRISEHMEARLTGQGFAVEAITSARQAVSATDVTRWRWEVTPTKSGRQRLHLTLTAIITVRGKSSERTVRTFERTLAIDVSLSARAKRFVENNWEWLWTTILLPVGARFANQRRKNASG